MNTAEFSAPGTYRRTLKFSPPSLAGWEWPTIEIVGENPGPRIAIWAGMHVNELSSIEAAFRIAISLDPSAVHGRVSILPILNLPAWQRRTKIACPIDGKDINFCFPGSPSGTFSDVLAYTLLNEWANDAICTFDLHGGDLNEDVAQHTMIQLTGDETFDSELREAADGFGATTRVELAPEHMNLPGRSITGRSKQRKLAVISEAGCSNVRLADEDVAFHMQGVLGVAAKLGVVDASRITAAVPISPGLVPSEVHVVHSTINGWGTHLKRPGEPISRGDVLAEVRDYTSGQVSMIRSPHDGHVIWSAHHPALEPGQPIVGVAI